MSIAANHVPRATLRAEATAAARRISPAHVAKLRAIVLQAGTIHAAAKKRALEKLERVKGGDEAALGSVRRAPGRAPRDRARTCIPASRAPPGFGP